MRRILTIAVAAAALIPAAAQAQNVTTISGSMPVSVSIYLPLTTSFKQAMSFGNILLGSVVSIDSKGKRTGDPADFIPTNGGNAGAFEIVGSPNARYTVALTVTQEPGAPVYTLAAATNAGAGSATSGQLNSGGGDVIFITGTADATRAKAGWYGSATATVSLNYM